jgi:hypothetical protein
VTTPTFRFWSDTDLENLAPVPWLLARVLQSSALAVLYGPSGVGKSFFALALAVAVALDREWLDRAVQGGRVVYLAAEGARTLGPRLAALKEWHGVTAVPNLTIVPDAVYLHHAAHLGAYLTQLREHVPSPIALTVIDTLSRCSAGSDENSNADRELTVEGLNHIRAATEGTILAVHHTGWNEDRMRGGSSLQAAADAILALKRADGGIELKVEKQRDDEAGEVIGLHLQPCLNSLVVTVGVTLGVLSEKARKLLKTLDEISLGDGIATSVWEKASGLPVSSFYATRKSLVTAGYVEAVHGSRKWVPSQSGRELLQLQENSKALQEVQPFTPLQYPPSRGVGVVVSGEEIGDAWEEPEAA